MRGTGPASTRGMTTIKRISRLCWAPAAGASRPPSPIDRSAEDVADLASQHRRRERLLEKRDPWLQNAVPDDRVVGITGDEQHLHVRPRLPEPVRQLTAAHL